MRTKAHRVLDHLTDADVARPGRRGRPFGDLLVHELVHLAEHNAQLEQFLNARTGLSLRLERLGAQHDITTLTSGQDTLDGWVRRHGLVAQDMDSARTFVLVGDGSVIGYFSLTMGSVRRADAPARLVRAMPAYPVGIVLLARLAVHRLHQDEGHGALLLAEALRKAVVAGEAAAARLVVVDAVDERAASFYAHHGFVAAPEHPLRLYRRMKDIRASLTAAGWLRVLTSRVHSRVTGDRVDPGAPRRPGGHRTHRG